MVLDLLVLYLKINNLYLIVMLLNLEKNVLESKILLDTVYQKQQVPFKNFLKQKNSKLFL